MKKTITKIALGIISITVLVLITGLLFQEKHWDGSAQWTFKVHICEQGTMRPVSNALVKVVVKNETTIGPIEAFVEPSDAAKCTTNADGNCELISEFNRWGRESLLKYEEYVEFNHRAVQVQAKGYHSVELPLRTFISSPYRLDHKGNYNGSSEINVKLSTL